MSFLIYGAVILVAAASAMFGLDLLTAPLPPKPALQATSTAAPNKLEQHIADRQQEAADAARRDDRALTPVIPASPGGSKEVRMVYPPTNETTGASRGGDQRPAPQPVQTAQAPQAPAQSEPTQSPLQPAFQKSEPAPPAVEAKAGTKAGPPPAAAPVTQHSSNRCDVSACAAAYSSFRASDCTYQPYSGARRVCDKAPDGVRQRSADNVRDKDQRLQATEPRVERQARKDAELRDVAQRVKELTSARNTFGVDDDVDDASVGRRVIVIDRGYGGGFGGWR